MASLTPARAIGLFGVFFTLAAIVGFLVYTNHKSAEAAQDRASVLRFMDSGMSEDDAKRAVRGLKQHD